MTKQNPVARAKEIIAENRYMTIATASSDGKPWISPVAFCYDDNYNLFWVSGKNALHSTLIRKNPRVAITIFDSQVEDGKAEAVYFEAEASQLEDDNDLKYAVKILAKRDKSEEFKIKTTDQVTGEKAWRIYRAIPIKVHKLVEAEHVDGQYIDRHVEIDLAAIKSK